MKNKKSILILLAVLLTAAACIYTLIPHKPETPFIGRWKTDRSVLGYSPLSDIPDAVEVSFAYESQGSERREIHNAEISADAKVVPFHYEVEDDTVTIWQGLMMERYRFSITEAGDTETMTLTKDDGTTLLLTRISKHP